MEYSKLRIYFLLALLVGALVLTFLLFLPFLTALLFATGIAVVFHPVYERFNSFLKGKKSLAAFSTIVLVFLLLIAPLIFFGFQIFQESQDLYTRLAAQDINLELLQKLFTTLEGRIRVIIPDFSIDLNAYSQQALSFLVQNFANPFSGITRFILSISLGLLALYYLLVDGKKLKQRIIALSPLADRHDEEIFDRLQSTINSVIRGSLTIAFIQGVLTGLGFAFFGIPNAALWGAVASVAALIPSFGTSLVILPGVLFLIFTGHGISAIGLGVWGVTAVGLIDNFLGPKLIKRGLPIHPFLILLSVLGGLNLFGLIGFLLGPLILSFLFTLLTVYQKEFQS